MKAVWVTRSFLDYRVPVYEMLSDRLDGQLVLFYNAEYVPERCCLKLRKALGSRAIGLRGERALRLGRQSGFANEGVRIPFQRGLVRAVLRERPDVLISDGFFQWTYAPLWLRATRHIPHVMCYERTAHNERNAQWCRVIYRKFVMRWIDAMCCNGRLCGEYTRHLGYPANRITYGHMVADVETFRDRALGVSEQRILRKRSAMGLQGTVFLYVGRLVPPKGIAQLLQAWNVLCASARPVTYALLLVGEGSHTREYQAYCAKNGLVNVRFAGPVDYDALPEYYRCADVLVMPTLEDNWSLVVPEAMACGLPVLCSKYNGCWPELVKPENGWVFDPLSISDTCNTLRRCVVTPASFLKAMGEASKRRVMDHTPSHAADAIAAACDVAVRRTRTCHEHS